MLGTSEPFDGGIDGSPVGEGDNGTGETVLGWGVVTTGAGVVDSVARLSSSNEIIGETDGRVRIEVTGDVLGLEEETVGVIVAGGREAGPCTDGAGVVGADDTVKTDKPFWVDGAKVEVGCTDAGLGALLVLFMVVTVGPWVCADPGKAVSERNRHSSRNLLGIVIGCTCILICHCIVPFMIG